MELSKLAAPMVSLLKPKFAIKYAEESHELCGSLTKAYPQDPEVRQACAVPPPTR